MLAVSLAFRGRIVIDPRPGAIYHAHPESLLRRSRGVADLLAKARRVRARLADPAVPRWARAVLPLVAVMHTVLILAVRPLYRLGRDGIRRRDG